MRTVQHSVDIAVPIDVTFAYIDNHRNVPNWAFGVKKFDAVGEQETGLGAVHNAVIDLGPLPLKIRSEITGWEQDELIALTARKGIEGTLSFKFVPTGDTSCRIDADVAYRVGGGLAGKVLERALAAFIPPALRHTEKQLQKVVTQHYASR